MLLNYYKAFSMGLDDIKTLFVFFSKFSKEFIFEVIKFILSAFFVVFVFCKIQNKDSFIHRKQSNEEMNRELTKLIFDVIDETDIIKHKTKLFAVKQTYNNETIKLNIIEDVMSQYYLRRDILKVAKKANDKKIDSIVNYTVILIDKKIMSSLNNNSYYMSKSSGEALKGNDTNYNYAYMDGDYRHIGEWKSSPYILEKSMKSDFIESTIIKNTQLINKLFYELKIK